MMYYGTVKEIREMNKQGLIKEYKRLNNIGNMEASTRMSDIAIILMDSYKMAAAEIEALEW